MPIIDRIDAVLFERIGTAMGIVCCLAIAAQCLNELRIPGRGSLSPVNVVIYLVLYVFWVLYGLRFRRPAIWAGNLLAVACQCALLAIWLSKR